MILNLKVIWLDFIILDVVVMNRSSYLAIEEPQSHFQWTAKLITDGGLVPILTPSQHYTQDSIPSQIAMQHVDALQNWTQSCVLLQLVRRNHQLPPHPFHFRCPLGDSSVRTRTWQPNCMWFDIAYYITPLAQPILSQHPHQSHPNTSIASILTSICDPFVFLCELRKIVKC